MKSINNFAPDMAFYFSTMVAADTIVRNTVREKFGAFVFEKN